MFPVREACDIKGQESLVPEQERDNIWTSINQEITESIKFNMASYYTKRKNTYSRYPLGDSISGESPVDLMVPGNLQDLYEVPSLGFSYGANPAYKNRDMTIDFETWGFSPEFTIALPNEWELRQIFHYGESETKLIDPTDNRAKMLAYYDDGNGPLDPANIASLDAAIIDDIMDYETVGETTQELFLSRTVVDGALFELPAGTVRMALPEGAQNIAFQRTFGSMDSSIPATEVIQTETGWYAFEDLVAGAYRVREVQHRDFELTQ